jgi:hypothetical protein
MASTVLAASANGAVLRRYMALNCERALAAVLATFFTEGVFIAPSDCAGGRVDRCTAKAAGLRRAKAS